LDVLRTAVDETVANALVKVLLAEALDRLEGRPKQQLDLNDITAAMSNRSADDLTFYAEHGYWPRG
jgi:hypothetical protein